MTRRLLLAAGGAVAKPAPVPPDPSLSEPRFITAPLAINQNVMDVTGDGRTWEHQGFRVVEDAADVRLLFSGYSQGAVADPATLKASIRKPGSGSFVPVTFGGSASGTFGPLASLTSDPITGPFLQGGTFDVRVFSPAQAINVGRTSTTAVGEHLTENPMPSPDLYPAGGPVPIGMIGSCRASSKSLALVGDSIAAGATWWSLALAAHDTAGVNLGRNVAQFGGANWADTSMPATTHALVQFGVNDLGGSPTVDALWTKAVGCYDALLSYTSADLLLWQTTPTPMVTTTDTCATLEGQTVYAGAARQAWIAFLRDGAPCDPTTRAALSVGAGGSAIRAGQAGHPLQGIVDMAAAVEDGGLSGTGKWRVDLGPIGGDGVHPADQGQSVMTDPVADWLATL